MSLLALLLDHEGIMHGPDIFRAVLISMVSLLLGLIAFGSIHSWRRRGHPVPARVPLPAVQFFGISYIMLLVTAATGLLYAFGEPAITAYGVTTLVAIAFNVAAVAVIVYYRINGHTFRKHLFSKVVEHFEYERRRRNVPVAVDRRKKKPEEET